MEASTAMAPRQAPEAGRRLIIAFDVGTTYSGISYCIQEPPEPPKICSVTRFPGQEHVAGSSKIPTILYYDNQGHLRAAGAETMLAENVDLAEDEGWQKVEWFKLRLRPEFMPMKLSAAALPPLPSNKSAVDVFGDMLHYLMKCAKQFIMDAHFAIASDWNTLREKAEFVITHPNGWEGAQQTKLTRAAIIAGLVPDSLEGRSRMTFLSEGEASLHFCVGRQFVPLTRQGFVIADLGGGTLDFGAYKMVRSEPITLEELTVAECELEGSTFVTLRARSLLMEKLRRNTSPYGTDAHIKQISAVFDETTKRTFRSPTEACHIRFGSLMDNDIPNGIRSGKLKLSGDDVARLFEPAIKATVAAIKAIENKTHNAVDAVYLVGGFCANPFVLRELKDKLGDLGITVNVPDGQTSKAVAEGAVAYHLHHYVSARIAKICYGLEGVRTYDERNADHVMQKLKDKLREDKYGERVLAGAFISLLKKGSVLTRDTVIRRSFGKRLSAISRSATVTFPLMAYRGRSETPEWIDDSGSFQQLCTITAEVPVPDSVYAANRVLSPSGTKVWTFEYDIVLSFGEPQLKAEVVWKDGRISKRSSAQISFHSSKDEFEAEEPEDDLHTPAASSSRV